MTKGEAESAVEDFVSGWSELHPSENYTKDDVQNCLEDLTKEIPGVLEFWDGEGTDNTETVEGWIWDQMYEIGNRNRLGRLVGDPRS